MVKSESQALVRCCFEFSMDRFDDEVAESHLDSLDSTRVFSNRRSEKLSMSAERFENCTSPVIPVSRGRWGLQCSRLIISSDDEQPLVTNNPTLNPLFEPDYQRAWGCVTACPVYKPTSVLDIVDDGRLVWVKDESTRLGLGSFKALGGVYAVAQLVLEKVATESGQRPTIDALLSDEVRAIAQTMTFVCASAGNHGMAVAAGAKLLGATARVYLSDEVPISFARRLEERGATVCVSGASYEQSLEAANKDASDTGALLLADGSWQGYTHPPSLVMEGYTVIASELYNMFKQTQSWPTDVYLQAGVGGMAAAVAVMIRKRWLVQPRIVVVEPTAADCLAQSAAKKQLIEVTGPISNMGRLDCKAPSLLAFQALSQCDVQYLTISDSEASNAVLALGYYGLQTTPSGAAGFAAWQRDRALDRTDGIRPLVIMSEQA